MAETRDKPKLKVGLPAALAAGGAIGWTVGYHIQMLLYKASQPMPTGILMPATIIGSSLGAVVWTSDWLHDWRHAEPILTPTAIVPGGNKPSNLIHQPEKSGKLGTLPRQIDLG